MRFLSADKDWIWIGALIAMAIFHAAGKIQSSYDKPAAQTQEAIEARAEKAKVAVK